MALAVRVAHSLQLHREESYASLSFFQDQIHRRTWFCLLGLDFQASLDRGTDPAIPANSYNTKFGLNIDDSDFNISTEKMLVGRSSFTGMTFFTIASECAYMMRALNFVPVGFYSDHPPEFTILIIVQAREAEQFPYGVDEFERAGLEKEKARLSDIPMVKQSPVRFECSYHTTLRLPGNPPMGTCDIIIGKVEAVHIAEEVLTDGMVDITKTMPIARCGYHQYTVVKDTFEMTIPGNNHLTMLGLEGNAKKVASFDAAQRAEAEQSSAKETS